MEIRDLKVFHAVYHHENISKAAIELNYVQSNVTARIKSLEKELQTPLFHRHKRGMIVTPEGKKLYEYTKKMVSDFDNIQSLFLNSDDPKGCINIGTVEIVTQLPTILSQYIHNFPHVDINISTGVSETLLDKVINFELDGAFITGPIQHPFIEQHPVIEEELVLVANFEEFSKEKLYNENLLVFNKGCGYRLKLEKWLTHEGILPNRIIEFNTLETIIGGVGLGLGITCLPTSYIKQATTKGNVYFHKMPKQFNHISTVFIRRKDIALSNSIAQLLNVIESATKHSCS